MQISEYTLYTKRVFSPQSKEFLKCKHLNSVFCSDISYHLSMTCFYDFSTFVKKSSWPIVQIANNAHATKETNALIT